ncbi:Autotransporter beta-domain protein [Pigmentiphaga humi]|uniref:Autotransporter beta-domain protein n=1 Tax=Pigmentiphaga humi TaxID=2478468 RepID=A0A3P4B4U8_9BURK|nr:Autotransporter beta-domain protein [Pigmentiphaga humi]
MSVTGSNTQGSAVTVTSGGKTRAYTAAIITSGDDAAGILAQSVGGGGGRGGASTSTAQSGGANAVSLGLGGAAGSGSSGGAVNVCGQVSGGACTSAMTGAAILTAGVHSTGILAQSIGGGGGSGGSSSSIASANAGGADGGSSFGASLGGKTGGGGSGGAVAVNTNVTVQTLGDMSAAVLAQSIGGGGGEGGGASAGATGGNKVSASLALGGTGGSGGNGGSVTVALGGSGAEIVTGGANAPAVVAQSVGGGGGTAGMAATTSSATGAYTPSIGGALGGTGGSGGNGGTVNLTSNVAVTTTGMQSIGLLAQSIGGGGGLATASTGNAAIFSGTMTLGSKGGSGGAGGAAYVTASGSVTTYGLFSSGIVAQSVGGGGGVSAVRASNVVLGGTADDASGVVNLSSNAVVTTVGGASAGLVAQSIASGGLATSGGSATLGGAPSGSNGAAVNVCNSIVGGNCASNSAIGGSIATWGDASIGLLAQSIGGGGGAVLASGNAVSADFKNGVGYSGTVTTVQNAGISTAGAGSAGVLAQSVGGGGGTVVAAYNNAGNASYAANLGGSGMSNDYGAAVSVTAYEHAIGTAGPNAPGVVAQSIGAGGGYYSASNLAAGGKMNVSFTLGADAGSGVANAVKIGLGSGGAATAVSTAGANSAAVVAQSIGGGGGIASFYGAPGGSAVNGTVTGQLGQVGGSGMSGTVNVSGSAIIRTTGLQSAGLLAQSITGGGGLALAASSDNSLFSGTVRLGSTKGGSNYTNPVAVNLTGGSIATSGAMSPGIVAQDIGGGGGLSLVDATNVVLGGVTNSSSYTGSTSNNSAAVTNGAAITTSGAGSIGIVAQSVAGGGGLAYASGSATLGGAPSGSNAGAVLVNSNAAISTSGVNAFGILAQSVGGGGGAVISTGGAVAPTFKAGSGNASAVTVNVNASIATTGAGAHGVVAQSVRGGGGLVTNGTTTVMQGGTSGSSGLVKVNVASGVNVVATGQGAVGIKTWSSTDPIVNIASGATVVGGTGGSALEFEGPTNELNNSGSVGSIDGADGAAVRTISGDTTVNNSGALQGNIHLAKDGSNLVHNLGTGTLVAGSTLDLGDTGLLRNDGVLANGNAAGSVTRITGSLEQSASGVMDLRVDHANARIDAFEVSGSAKLLGSLRPTLVNGGLIAPGTTPLGSFLHAADGVDASGLSIGNTAILSFALHRSGNDVSLSSTADFSPLGLGADSQQIGALIARAQSQGLQHFQPLVAGLVQIPTVTELSQAYWNVSGAAASSVAMVGEQMGTAFNRVLLQRATDVRPSRAAVPPGSRQPGGEAWQDGRDNTWAQIYGDSTRMGMDDARSNGNLSSRSLGLVIGHDSKVSPDTTVGVALGSGVAHFDVGDHFNGRNNALQVGAYALQRAGAAYAAAAVSYSLHRMTTDRSLPAIQSTYATDFHAHSVGSRVEAGYRFEGESFAVTPYAALQLQRVTTPGYAETGGSGAAADLTLAYQRRSANYVRTELGLAFDKNFALEGGKSLAVRTSAAWAHNHSDNPDLHTSFNALGAGNFTSSALAPTSDLALVSAGVELRLANRLSVGVSLYGEFGHRTQAVAGRALMRYQW